MRWAEGNPAGKQPGSFAPKGDGTISLQAHLFKLLTWNFDDIDEQYRPPVLAALAVANGAELYRKMFYGGIEIIANGLGADITKLTNSDTKKRDAELDKLKERGLPTGPLVDAVKAWWKAKAPEDRARELLGEAGAIAMLKSDGWTVNPRPQGNYSHDIVAVKDGQVMVVEAKGGKGGGVKLGESSVEGGAYGATQMTDPYLWAKLKEDADDDPAFRDWLDKHGAWDAVENEDPSRVGYRLIKTDTDGNIIVYGSTQEPVNGGVPDNTVIGKTTGNKPKTPPKGNKPGTPPDNPNPGPTLHGVALPLTAGPLDQILTPAHAWLDDLSHRHLRDLAAIARLAVPLPAIPTPQLGPWPRRTPTDQSLTVTITPTRPPTRDITKAEQRRCMIYGAHL